MNKTTDPAIDEIRQIRHEISAEFDHDPKKLYSYYKQIEDKLRSTGQYTFLDNFSSTTMGNESIETKIDWLST